MINDYEEEFEEPVPRKIEVKKESKANKATSERQYWIQMTADMLKVPFKSVLFKTINWPMEWIKDHYLQCINPEVDNPARLWWGLIKKSKMVK